MSWNTAGAAGTDTAAVHATGNKTISGVKTFVGDKGLTLDQSDTNPDGQFRLYGVASKTGLTGSPVSFLGKLIVGDPAYVGDDAHDWNNGLFLVNYLANGTPLSCGSIGFGDAIYANNTDTSRAQIETAGRPYAINAEAGSTALAATDTGTGANVTYTASTVVDTDKTWTVNQWANRWVQVGSTPSTAVRGFVASNTATTLTLNALGWCTTVAADVSQASGATTPTAGSTYALTLSPATAIHGKVFSDGNGLYLNRVSTAGTSSPLINVNDSAGLTGQLVYIRHDTSAMAGNAIEIDVANGGGAFTGSYLSMKAAGTVKASIAADGSFTGKNLVAITGTSGDATLQARFKGGSTAIPTTGTWSLRDFLILTSGNIVVCTAAGTPGTWKTITAA